MSQTSAIEWTEATWNPVTGCSKVSPGCAHCYAETVAARFWPQQYVHTVERGFISVKDYRGDRMDGRPRAFTDVMCHEDRLDAPLRRKKPTTYFVNSMSDLFHEDVPDAFIDRVFAVIALAPQHTFQVLTKRADRMQKYFRLLEDGNGLTREERIDRAAEGFGACHANLETPGRWPLPNVWLGVSVENQHFADERIPLLLQTPAAVRFISAEPLLGPVELTGLFAAHFENPADDSTLDWVIVGGESGPGARPCDLGWIRSIIEQCHAARVPVFVKQLGARSNYQRPRAALAAGAGVECPHGFDVCPTCDAGTLPLRDRKGGDPAEWPEYFRRREFPMTPEVSR